MSVTDNQIERAMAAVEDLDTLMFGVAMTPARSGQVGVASLAPIVQALRDGLPALREAMAELQRLRSSRGQSAARDRVSDDPFRWCVHCGTDCQVDEPEHADTCPATTGVWPVREEEAFRCPHCGKNTREMTCMDCGDPLEVGDHYALRDPETQQLVIKPEAWGIGEVICLGCAAALGLLGEGRA